MSRSVEVSNRLFNGDAGTPLLNVIRQETSNGGPPNSKEDTMTNRFRILSAIAILSVTAATPVLAQDASASRQHHARVRDQSNFRGAYNQSNGPSYAAPLTSEEYRNQEDFGWTGRDPSRVGGMFPYFNGGSGS
jgi:hypothetical protein